MSEAALTDEQQELIGLLCSELEELAAQEPPEPADNEGVSAFIGAHSLLAENIGNAAELVGLDGLSAFCQFIMENISQIGEGEDTASAEQLALMQHWCPLVLSYLHQLHDNADPMETVAPLIEYLLIDGWPRPIASDRASAITEQFLNTSVDIEEDNDDSIPAEATADLVSLDIAEDVRPELLEGLLLELPTQTESFARAIENYLSAGGQGYLQDAQRVAHTIKGAANVVGISGIANLMHYSEEVLELLDKARYDVPIAFAEFMQEVSDCLEGMSEALLGREPPPDNAVAVLQQLLDWTRNIKNGELAPAADTSADPAAPAHAENDTAPGESAAADESATAVDITAGDTTAGDRTANAPDPATQPAPSKQAPPSSIQEQASGSLRVNDTLLQELLRIIGENIITNNRMQAQIDQLKLMLAQTSKYQESLSYFSEDMSQYVDTQYSFDNRNEAANDTMDPLELHRYNEWHSFSHQLRELTTDSRDSVQQLQTMLTDLYAVSIDQQQINRENQDLVMRMRMVSVSTQTSRLHRCVRQACRLTRKNAQLRVIGDELQVDSRILTELMDPLMHLLRNAVDHGIENEAQRQAAGKDSAGEITLEFTREGGAIAVHCRDDGAGIDFQALAHRAKELGLIADESMDDPQHLQNLIFHPGFSTRAEVTQTSGRGIGLDAVASKIKMLKGNITVHSEPGGGTRFTLIVPITLLSTHGLLIHLADTPMTVVSRGIEQIIYLEGNEFIRVRERLCYPVDDHMAPVYTLEQLCGVEAEADKTYPILLLAADTTGNRFGILVDGVSSSHEMVVKPLNRYSFKPPGIIGATVLGNGEVSPVLDLPDLIEARLLADSPQSNVLDLGQSARGERNSKKHRPMALVVDDSLSARRSLAQFVADIGMEVRTAKDGFEAIDVIDEKTPSLMLVDLEMPRMNGLELTQHIRARAETRDVPVIMITSRTTDKHRDMASAAGVNCYLNKPYSEDDLLRQIETQLQSAESMAT